MQYSYQNLQPESIKFRNLTTNFQEIEAQRNILNDASRIQSAKSRTWERLQAKQAVFQQINYNRRKGLDKESEEI